jgi:hypothetical protein
LRRAEAQRPYRWRSERDSFEATDTQRRVVAACEHPSAGGDVYWLHAESLSVISYQLSVISYQLSVISYQLSG